MKPKVLYVAGITQFIKPRNGGQIRAHEILKQLCSEFEVHIFSPYLPKRLAGPGIDIHGNLCPTHLLWLFKLARRRGFSRLIDGALRRYSRWSHHPLRNPQFYERHVLERKLRRRHSQFQYVFYDTSRYAPIAPPNSLRDKSLLIAHNVDSVLQPQSSFHPAFESRLDQLFGTVITCTETDAGRFQSTSPAVSCIVWPNGTSEPEAEMGQPSKYDLLFVGALNFKPNREAVQFLIEELHPLLHEADMSLCIAGRSPGPAIREQASSAGISLLADVEDLSSVYASARMAIVPLMTGSGSRLKIAEALIHGLPVVSTSIGAEGYPQDQRGLYREECASASRFLDTIQTVLSKTKREDREDIQRAARPFLWSNTLDLSLLP